MGNVSNIEKIDLSLKNIWHSWFLFRRGKRKIKELEFFQYYLEENLWWLYEELNKNIYCHGPYQYFVIQENKRRDIVVAQIRDRVVHRLAYEYLVKLYDKTFIYDVWSCRKNKGLLGAIERTQKFFKKYPHSFFWRSDITKFFDNVNATILYEIICRRVKDKNARRLLKIILDSYNGRCERERGTNFRGIPIGNLTSQIFANIYLNELDRLVKYALKPLFYLRYGDDFIIITKTKTEALEWREEITKFLKNSLRLEINRKNDILLPVRRGIHFLGVDIYSTGRRLKKQNWCRVQTKLDLLNFSSYYGLVKQHDLKKLKNLNWLMLQIL